ncbi:MAG: TIGR04133 family radical SAM/SPASM protein [Bacteroidales bacterium]|nr:TIGR04133 family radical SAM/SPASM protein [Bacteroidales bacterium]
MNNINSGKNPFYPNFRQRLSLRIFKKYINVEAKLHNLTYLFWECTTRCNISCIHCGSDCRTDNISKDMPAEDFLKVTSALRKVYNPNKLMIVLTGGEPLLRKDLEAVGKEFYNQGYPWGMVTNGFALTQERFNNLLSSGLRSITLSLDGLEENHNWLRGHKQSYKKAIEALKIIQAGKDIIFDVVTCVNAQNFEQLEDIKNLLIGMNVRLWRIFTISPIGRAKDNPLLHISPKQFHALMEFIKNAREEGKIIPSYGCEGFLGSYEGKVRDGYFFCRAGINIGSVLNDGSISACPNNSSKVIQGNIYQDDFIDVWQNKYQIMRDRSWTKTGLCKDCKEHVWCRGNGLHLRDFENNTVMRCHYKDLNEGIKDTIF